MQYLLNIIDGYFVPNKHKCGLANNYNCDCVRLANLMECCLRRFPGFLQESHRLEVTAIQWLNDLDIQP